VIQNTALADGGGCHLAIPACLAKACLVALLGCTHSGPGLKRTYMAKHTHAQGLLLSLISDTECAP
jgi:hypothetical protein